MTSSSQSRGIDATIWLQHAWRNRVQSLFLLAAMGAFLALLGALLWGPGGILMLVAAGVFGVALNPAVSPSWIMRLYGARPIHLQQAPQLWSLVERLAARAELPRMPHLYYLPSSMLNAFAVGTRKQAAIAVTDGLLRDLKLREVAGVLAHEISHIHSNDLWVMGLADLFSRATHLLSLMGQFLLILNIPLILLGQEGIDWLAILLLVFAPHISALAQLALSRTREYDADLNAARLTGDPEGLARALAKIERVQGGWLERIFMPGRRVPEPSLLRTHPQTNERITRLLALMPQLHGLDGGSAAGPTPGVASILGAPVVRRPGWHISGLWY
jgi:heat shock protein HtpX